MLTVARIAVLRFLKSNIVGPGLDNHSQQCQLAPQTLYPVRSQEFAARLTQLCPMALRCHRMGAVHSIKRVVSTSAVAGLLCT